MAPICVSDGGIEVPMHAKEKVSAPEAEDATGDGSGERNHEAAHGQRSPGRALVAHSPYHQDAVHSADHCLPLL
jgi:hypothetical protein